MMLQQRKAKSATQQDCASAAIEKVTREYRTVSDDSSSDSDVGESPDAFIEELLRPTAFWTQRIRWRGAARERERGTVLTVVP